MDRVVVSGKAPPKALVAPPRQAAMKEAAASCRRSQSFSVRAQGFKHDIGQNMRQLFSG
jgi:hypothetical protein